MNYEGGFNGRTNKLVDTCYTWWVGAMSRILCDHLKIEKFWNQFALENYVLSVCQTKENGGLCDKPGKKPDLFHTMYGSSGIAATRGFIKDQKIADVDARYGIPKESAIKIINHFKQIPFENIH